MASRITNDYHKEERRKKDQEERDRIEDISDAKKGRPLRRLQRQKDIEEYKKSEMKELRKNAVENGKKSEVVDQVDEAVHYDKQAMANDHVTPGVVPRSLKGVPTDNIEVKKAIKNNRGPKLSLKEKISGELSKFGRRTRKLISSAFKKKTKVKEIPEGKKKTKTLVDKFENM